MTMIFLGLPQPADELLRRWAGACDDAADSFERAGSAFKDAALWGAAVPFRRRARKAMINKRLVRVMLQGVEVSRLHYKLSRRGNLRFVRPLAHENFTVEWPWSGTVGRTRYRTWNTRDAQRLARRRTSRR